MRRIIVDSGSSIKMNEKEQYGVDILPIQLKMGDDFFLDGVNLSTDEFYRRLKDSSQFPKTSLPNLEETQKLVDQYTSQGDEVLIITISSGISGTYQADKEYGIIAAYTYNKGNVDNMIQMLPDDYKSAVSVYDDLCCSIACHWGPNAFGFIYVRGIEK